MPERLAKDKRIIIVLTLIFASLIFGLAWYRLNKRSGHMSNQSHVLIAGAGMVWRESSDAKIL